MRFLPMLLILMTACDSGTLGPVGSFVIGDTDVVDTDATDTDAADTDAADTDIGTPGDVDGDGLLDLIEDDIGTDPHNPDSDNDGFNDFEEVSNNRDPLNIRSWPFIEPGRWPCADVMPGTGSRVMIDEQLPAWVATDQYGNAFKSFCFSGQHVFLNLQFNGDVGFGDSSGNQGQVMSDTWATDQSVEWIPVDLVLPSRPGIDVSVDLDEARFEHLTEDMAAPAIWNANASFTAALPEGWTTGILEIDNNKLVAVYRTAADALLAISTGQ
ncbi:hypothetical protein UFOVP1382_196 [uncultured Caudovirales phage]|uniref:Uncharacterized protein n=1 Tax=uncultured Caudovirales phage TaxID=2100421 RepID=A0A6J5S5C3_9CAUD|nr:hypothetical protein UFOVP1382_196 [uncultured Caudovirales phage]